MQRANGFNLMIVSLILSMLPIFKLSALEVLLPMMISMIGRKGKTVRAPIC
jgi:hypothetical protein